MAVEAVRWLECERH